MSKPSDEYEIRARMLRLLAARHRARAAELDMMAAMAKTTGSMKRLMGMLTEAEAREVAEHPDLAELNVQLDGLYGAGPVCPDEEPTT